MVNPLAKNDVRLDETIQALAERGDSLALQHLNYTLTMEHNRAILTQHAMRDAEVLLYYAQEIMGENPGATEALEEIMRSYLDSASGTIRDYCKPEHHR